MSGKGVRGEHPEKPKQPTAHFRGRGLTLLILAVGVLFVLNSRTLWALQATVRADKRQAIEASRPAEISLTVIVQPDCLKCFSPAVLTRSLKSNTKLKIKTEREVTATSAQGQALIKDLKLTHVPAVVIDGQIAKALAAAGFLKTYGSTTSDSRFVVSSLPPPYLETSTGAVRGLVDATYLIDTTCKECYDATKHRSALGSVGLAPNTETTIDRQDPTGKELIKKYGIESVPTLLLTGDLKVYQRLQNAWSSVGTIEADGTYVFRSGQPQMGTYYDLKAKKLIKAEQPSAQTNQTK